MFPQVINGILVLDEYPDAIPVIGIQRIDIVAGIPAVFPAEGETDIAAIDGNAGDTDIVGMQVNSQQQPAGCSQEDFLGQLHTGND